MHGIGQAGGPCPRLGPAWTQERAPAVGQLHIPQPLGWGRPRTEEGGTTLKPVSVQLVPDRSFDDHDDHTDDVNLVESEVSHVLQGP